MDRYEDSTAAKMEREDRYNAQVDEADARAKQAREEEADPPRCIDCAHFACDYTDAKNVREFGRCRRIVLSERNFVDGAYIERPVYASLERTGFGCGPQARYFQAKP